MKKASPFLAVLVASGWLSSVAYGTDPKALNRWVEASDFRGVTAKFSTNIEMDPWNKGFIKRLENGNNTSRCTIYRQYQTEVPSSLTLTGQQTWTVEEPQGAYDISPAKKKAVVDELAVLKQEAHDHYMQCKHYSLLALPEENFSKCYNLLKEGTNYSKKSRGMYWYVKQPNGDRKLEISVQHRDGIYLSGASKGLHFRLVSKSGDVVNVSCEHNPSSVNFDERPEMIVAQYHSILSAAGIVLKKNNQYFKPYFTNAEAEAAEKAANETARNEVGRPNSNMGLGVH
jgi:hypothetical protein